MKFFEKISLFIKKIINKNQKAKELEAPSKTENITEKLEFVESLKAAVIDKKEKNKVETIICYGDGLGIQKKISS